MAKCTQSQAAQIHSWIAAAEYALAQSPGVVSVSVDGQTTTWNRDALLRELAYHRRRLARMDGSRPLAMRVNLE